MFDITSMTLGFRSYCKAMFDVVPGVQILSSRTSQDALENFFGCQRAQQGQNNNPTVLQYGKTSIRLLPFSKLCCQKANYASSNIERFTSLTLDPD